MRLAAVALLSTVLGVACGGTDEDPGAPGFGTPLGGGTAGGATTGGAGGTTGATGASPVVTGPGGIGGTGATGGTVPGGTAGGTGGTSTPGGTGGGADSQWCQVKQALGTRCTACHGATPTSGAPFPLVTYADFTAPHPTKTGKKVYERVGVRVHADKSQLENLGSMPPGTELPAATLALVDAWVAAKAPAGADPTCAGLPVVVAPTTEWPPKECDGVYKIVAHGAGGVSTPLMATPGGETHPQVKWDAPWGSEQVQAIAYKTITDNAKVLHHWILSANGAFITGWAPGEDGIKMMRPDVGALLPGGNGVLNLDMHYFNTTGTKSEPDNSGVEVCIVKKEHFRKNTSAVTMGLSNFLFSIPAHSTNYDVKASCTVSGSSPITLLTVSPHAHKLARHMKFDIKKKNGQAIVMHDMPFMFGEQKTYPLDPPVVVEAGDVINTTCTYANDGNSAVTFGENTGNEMCFNFASYYPAGALTCGGGLDIGSLFGGL